MSKAAEVDKLLEQHMRGGLSRRQFMMRAGALGLSLPAIGGLLAACTQAAEAPTATSVPAAATAVAATATPARGLRRFEGMPKPIAATEEERSAWWLNEMRSSKMTLDDVALSPEEEAEIKSMGLKVGATWISYASKKHFYRALTVERRCKELGIELISHNNEMSDARRLTTARIFIDEKVDAVIGNDGHGEAVKAYNEAGIPVFSQGNPFRGYYPTIATVGMNRYAAGEEQAGILASKLAAEGYTDATIAILDAPPTISWV